MKEPFTVNPELSKEEASTLIRYAADRIKATAGFLAWGIDGISDNDKSLVLFGIEHEAEEIALMMSHLESGKA